MSHESFHSFMLEIGAKKHAVSSTPFNLYLLGEQHLLIHFITLNTFTNTTVPINFFQQLSAQSPLIQHRIVHVWEDFWITKQELIKLRIRSLLGLNRKIHARQTEVVRLNKIEATQFLDNYHLQQSTSAYYKLGLVYANKLIAVATFSKARTMYDGPVYYRSYELERFATVEGLHIVGGLSKMISHFRQLTNAAHIMTYADRDWSIGNSYIKLGFVCTEETPPAHFLIEKATYARFFNKQIHSNREQYWHVWNAGSLKFVADWT